MAFAITLALETIIAFNRPANPTFPNTFLHCNSPKAFNPIKDCGKFRPLPFKANPVQIDKTMTKQVFPPRVDALNLLLSIQIHLMVWIYGVNATERYNNPNGSIRYQHSQ